VCIFLFWGLIESIFVGCEWTTSGWTTGGEGMDLVILWVTNCVTDGGLVESFVRRQGVRGYVSVGAVGHTLGMASTRELLRAGMWISGARRSVVAAALVAAFVTAGSLPDGDSGGRHLWRTPVWCVDHAVSSQEMQGLKRLMGKEKKRNPRTQVISNIGGYQSNVDWIHREGHAEDIKRLHNTILRQTAEFLHAWEVSGEAGTHGGGRVGKPAILRSVAGWWLDQRKQAPGFQHAPRPPTVVHLWDSLFADEAVKGRAKETRFRGRSKAGQFDVRRSTGLFGL
jgi:hypothetical protein